MENNKATVELKIDFRERTASNRKYIGQLPDNIAVHYTQLSLGDYVIDNKVIVERKTVADFRNSVKDGRIFRQAYRMSSVRMPSIIIVEGDPEDQNGHNLERHAFLGVMVHLSVILGIPVIASTDYRETLYLFETIARQLESVKQKRGRIYGKKFFPENTPNANRTGINMLQTIPGLGTRKAMALLQKFGSLKNIVLATEDELRKAEGIGKKLSHIIVKAINNQ